jgi:hypothetical protein
MLCVVWSWENKYFQAGCQTAGAIQGGMSVASWVECRVSSKFWPPHHNDDDDDRTAFWSRNKNNSHNYNNNNNTHTHTHTHTHIYDFKILCDIYIYIYISLSLSRPQGKTRTYLLGVSKVWM